MECVYRLINLITVRPLCMLNALVGTVIVGVYKNDLLKLSNLPITLSCLRSALLRQKQQIEETAPWLRIAVCCNITAC